MQWTQEADLLLFKYLLQIHEIKPDYKKLAEAMGNGITAKAITHRIARVRGLPAMQAEGDAPATPKASPKPKKTPVTPKGKGKKRDAEDDEGETVESAKKVKVEA